MESRYAFVIAVFAAVCGVCAGIAVGFIYGQTAHATAAISPEEAASKVSEMLSRMGANAEVVNITPVSGTAIYKVTTNITDMRGTREEIFYLIQRDGKFTLSYALPLPTIGRFSVKEGEICMEDGKPIVYFFGFPGCPHCVWEHPIFKNVTSKFAGFISVHDNYNNMSADRDVFMRFSSGGYPTIVLGCKFYRTGSGESIGKEEEEKVLTALICELTNGKPENICNAPEIQELRSQI